MNFDDLEPHLNADGYRNHHPLNLIDKQMDFIECNADGNFVIGCSSLTGRYWAGSLFYCGVPEGSLDNAMTRTKCETGIIDGKFIGNDKIIIAEDSGMVQIMSIKAKEEYSSVSSSAQRPTSMHCILSSCEHDSAVSSVSVFADLSHAVTGSLDKNIKVLDIETFVAEHTYRPAHRRSVMSVSAQPRSGNSSVFASCSEDGYAMLWDIRKELPASILVKNPTWELNALSWHSSKSDVLAIGTSRGNVMLMDVRQNMQLGSVECFDRPIYRLRFAHHRSDLLALCANDSQVKVLDCSSPKPKMIYEDDRHEDFVRGLSWHPTSGKLFSCGWDHRVLAHSISPPLPTME